jgi:hypothetical protein
MKASDNFYGPSIFEKTKETETLQEAVNSITALCKELFPEFIK